MQKIQNKRKKAFTLVELIIAITILAILGTIAFISFQGYMKDARDGNRVASISNIEKGLGLYNLETSKYPTPDKKDGQNLLQTGALSISGSIVEYSYLGEIGSGLTTQLKISKTPQDPLSNNKYTYTTTIDGRKYQIASILENPTSYKKSLVKQANAGNEGYVAKVTGNHDDIVIKETGSGNFITVVPSLVFDPNGSNVLNQSGTLSIVNNKGNLPYSPNSDTNIGNTITAEQLIREIRNNNLATTTTLKLPDGVTLDGSGVLNDYWIPNIDNTNWNTYSSGIILASLGTIGVNGEPDYSKLTEVLNGGSANNNAQPMASNEDIVQSHDIGNSLRFNGSNQYLSRTAKSGNRQKFTLSVWLKPTKILGTNEALTIINASTSSNTDNIQLYENKINIQTQGGNTLNSYSTAVFRDPSSWQHLVVMFDTTQSQPNTLKVWVNGVLQTMSSTPTNGYLSTFNTAVINRIGQWSSGVGNEFNGYMSDFNFVDSGALLPTDFGQFDVNGRWIPKAYTGSYGTNGFHLDFSNGANLGADSSGNNNNWNLNNIYGYQTPIANSSQVVSSAQTSISPSFKLSPGATINKVGSFSSSAGNGLKFKVLKKNSPGNYTVLSDLGTFNHSGGNTWQRWNLTTPYTLPTTTGDYYLAIYFPPGVVGGSFGYSSSVMPVAFMSGEATGTVTLNEYDTGYYTPIIGVGYSDNSVLAYDQMLDSPSNNFATLNPINSEGGNTISNGNLSLITHTTNWNYTHGSIGINSGKWYWETNIDAEGAITSAWLGIATNTSNVLVSPTASWAVRYRSNGEKMVEGVTSSYGETFTSGNKIGIALNLDNNIITFYKNNLPQGDISISNGKTWFPNYTDAGGSTATYTINFGQGGQTGLQYCAGAGGYFKYCPPTGFKALSTKNITYSIEKPSDYFDILTYTGNGTTRSLTGLSFKPDLVWFKNRTNGTIDHALYDSIRGVIKRLQSSRSDAEGTYVNTLLSFNNDGISLGDDANTAEVNQSGKDFVVWNWRKSSSSGFDIINYTGNSTAGRSLPVSLGGKSPDFAIIKRTNSTSDWAVYHKDVAAGRVLWLQSTVGINDVSTDDSSYNDQIQTTNDALILGATQSVNNSAGNYIAYVWSEIPGYSKFGSYTGNGSTDGPFIYTGFKPRYVIIKASTATSGWYILDAVRPGYNVVNLELNANLSNSEYTRTSSLGIQADFLANGFKLRTTDSGNGNNFPYIYAAFAELPFK